MGTVKYSGPIASFHCPTEATIRSLKVHFSPKQEGSGTPSPENVREIVGWDGVEVNKSRRNLMHLVGYSAVNLNTTTATRKLTNSNGTTINTIDPEKSVTITQTLWPNDSKGSYQNGYFAIIDDNLKFEERYDISFRVTNITNNPLNAALSDLMIYNSKGTSVGSTKIIDGDRITFKNAIYNQNTSTPLRHGFDIRICGMSCTISDFIVTAVDTEDGTYEPYQGETVEYEFGVLGKNKFDKSQCIDNCRIGKTDGRNYGDGGYYISPFIPVSVGASYTKNSPTIDAYHRFATYSEANTDSFIRILDNSNIITIDNGEKYVRFCGVMIEKDTAQLELGSTATAYEPYNPNHTVYGGWVDLISGEVCATYKMVDLNDLNWFYGSNRCRTVDLSSSIKTSSSYSSFAPLIGEQVTAGKMSMDLSNFPDTIACNSSGTLIKYYDGDLPQGKIVYELAEPITYHLTPLQLQTFLGNNNVWSNADYVEIEYDLHETQDILARKNFIIANQPHVEEASGAIATFNTDMAAKLKECKVGFRPKQDLHGYSKPWVGGAGKNLFNINSVEQDPDNISYSNETKRIFTPNTYSSGSSYSNYWSPQKVSSYSIQQNSITVDSNGGYGVGFAVAVTEGNYYLSWVLSGEGYASVTLYKTDGTAVIISNGGSNSSFTIPNDVNIIVITFRNKTSGTPATFSNIQLEKGSSATSYEPYENICQISGWTGYEVYRTGKNLFNKDTVINNSWIRAGNLTEENPLGTIRENASGYTLSQYIPVYPNTTYTIKYNSASLATAAGMVFFSEQDANSVISGISLYYQTYINSSTTCEYYTFTTPINCHYIRVSTPPKSLDVQLELGSSATEYEPYNGETIPITFPASINLLDTVAKTANKTLSSTGEEMSESGMTVTTFMKVSEGSEYTLTFTSTEGARTRRIYGYDSNKEPVQALASTSWVNVDSVGTLQATIPSGIEYIRVCYKTADTNISLIGPESSVFYGGYVDLVKGEIVQEWCKWIEDGSRAIPYWPWTSNEELDYKLALFDKLPYPHLDPYLAPNAFASNRSYSYSINNDPTWRINHGCSLYRARGLSFAVSYPYHLIGDTQEELRAYLAEYPEEFVYYLAEPIHYQLTPTTLKSIRGTNNIWSNANGDITVQFWKH